MMRIALKEFNEKLNNLNNRISNQDYNEDFDKEYTALEAELKTIDTTIKADGKTLEKLSADWKTKLAQNYQEDHNDYTQALASLQAVKENILNSSKALESKTIQEIIQKSQSLNAPTFCYETFIDYSNTPTFPACIESPRLNQSNRSNLLEENKKLTDQVIELMQHIEQSSSNYQLAGKYLQTFVARETAMNEALYYLKEKYTQSQKNLQETKETLKDKQLELDSLQQRFNIQNTLLENFIKLTTQTGYNLTKMSLQILTFNNSIIPENNRQITPPIPRQPVGNKRPATTEIVIPDDEDKKDEKEQDESNVTSTFKKMKGIKDSLPSYNSDAASNYKSNHAFFENNLSNSNQSNTAPHYPKSKSPTLN